MANPPLVFKTTTAGWVYNGDTTTLTQITDVDYPATTVPGIVYLDGTYYVMLPDGTIQGSDIENPLSWNALNFVNAEVETDGGVACAKYLNYLLAFGVWTTEVFYDNPNNAAPGSPLSRMDSAFMQVGCAAARSIAMVDNEVIWIGQTKEGLSGASAGKNVVIMSGFQCKIISTPFIDRIISSDDLSTVSSFLFKHGGHSFYVLTLSTIGISLVYDLLTGMWYQWTSMVAQALKAVIGITLGSDGVTATAHVTAHGYADGDVVFITGANQSSYNISANITYIDANYFSYVVAGTPATPATGTITSMGYTEGPLRFTMHTSKGGLNLFLDGTNGTLYQMLESNYNDNGSYINFLSRTINCDGGTIAQKRFTRLSIVGDKVVGNALVRYSKDDYQTHSKYRKVDLALNRSSLKRLGMARRASFDVRITDSIPVRLERMDVTIEGLEQPNQQQNQGGQQ